MQAKRMHWLVRAAIAIGVGSVYGAISVTLLMEYHEAIASAIGGGSYPTSSPVLQGLAISAAWFIPVLVLAFLVYGALTGRRSRHDDGETRCRTCGYILRGISEPRCPECGERI